MTLHGILVATSGGAYTPLGTVELLGGVALMFHAAGEMCRAALQLYHVMWGVRVAECFWGKDGIEGIETSRTIVDWL